MTNPLGELAFVAGYNGSKDPASAKKPFSATHSTLTVVPSAPVEPEQKDYFVERDGLKFAGTHLIIDLWAASRLDSLEIVEQALRDAANVSGAQIRYVELPHLAPTGGIYGLRALAEEHIPRQDT